jgi:hypothetical protein
MIQESATWFRAIQPQHWLTALQTSQTRAFPTRFSAGPLAPQQFDILYLAQDQNVALFEVQALLGSPYGNYMPQPARAWVILNVNVVLRNVTDLTPAPVQSLLQSTAQELTGDWFGYQHRQRSLSLNQPTGPAPTQELGAAMWGVPKLEAFKTVSSKVPDKRVLVVFPQKLRVGSRIDFHDPAAGKNHVITGTQP